MSIRGELVQAADKVLTAGPEDARDVPTRAVVEATLEAAADPNWAQRFADEACQAKASTSAALHKLKMEAYFEVIQFLKDNA